MSVAHIHTEPYWWRKYFTWPILFWLVIWTSINTGPWVFRQDPVGVMGWAHYLRTIAPLLCIFLISIRSSMHREERLFSFPLSVRAWFLYGIIGLAATPLSPIPWDALYWALCYLTVFAGVKFFIASATPLENAVQLNYLTWAITAVFLLIMVIAARDALFVVSGVGFTGYGIEGRMEEVGGMAMSRSSGLGRFASVPGVIAFTLLWQGSFRRRLLGAFIFVLSASLIYLMQSRGAMFAFGFSISFLLCFQGRRTRFFGAILLAFFGLLLFTDAIPQQLIDKVMQHISRGQTAEEFGSLTGRTRPWENAWGWIRDSPLWGWGFQADRFLIYEHVHNTYMYTLMTAGFLGAAAFAGGLLMSWINFIQLLRRGVVIQPELRLHLTQCAGILAFFTVRSIPEVSGAMFSVDLMVMLPAITFISLAARQASLGNLNSNLQ